MEIWLNQSCKKHVYIARMNLMTTLDKTVRHE
jgi:hypothetical protein